MEILKVLLKGSGTSHKITLCKMFVAGLPGKDNSSAQYGFTIIGGGCVQCYERLVCV
jgi:hypothetical protein